MIRIDINSLTDNYNKKQLLQDWFENTGVFLELVYLSDFGNTKYLRDFLAYIGEELQIDEQQVSRMILICDELNNNGIEYGSKKGSLNRMRIRAIKKDEKKLLQIEVEDTGDGKAPKTALDMETMRAHKLKLGYGKHDSIRGRGLFLITVQIAERLYFKNASQGGLVVGVYILFSQD